MRSSSSGPFVSERYFSPEEVEALIPRLTDIVDRLRDAQAAVAETRTRLQAEQQRLTLAGGGMLDRARWRADQEGMKAGIAEVKKAAEEIQALGGVPKGIEEGLVDFPHLRDGRVVNLCWKYGETRIRFWHGMDEGFAARKPL
jgi:hypothetical protein